MCHNLDNNALGSANMLNDRDDHAAIAINHNLHKDCNINIQNLDFKLIYSNSERLFLQKGSRMNGNTNDNNIRNWSIGDLVVSMLNKVKLKKKQTF